MIVSPSVATPITPTIGRSGNEMRSVMWIVSPSTRKTCVSGDRTCSISWPMPGMSVAKPRSTGRTSSSSTTSESPGSAPRTAIGPVALLTRSKSISVTRSASVWIWPVKQSLRLERDDLARIDLEHGLEVGPERPDDVVPADPMCGGGRHRSSV